MECPLCGKKSRIFPCQACRETLRHPINRTCRICGYPLTSEEDICMICRERTIFFNRHASLFSYRDKMRLLVLLWKYGNDSRLTSFFARCLSDRLSHGDSREKALLVPIPGNPRNNRKRGYDPVLILTKKISRVTGIRFLAALSRDRGSSQKACSSRDRISNLEGRIHIRRMKDRNRLKGINIIVIDDIYTTGSTINECSRVLSSTNPESISCYTLAQD